MTSKKDQIHDTILERVRRGTYDDKIPGERALAAEFGMDFKTVNRAIGELVDEGVLVRRRGLGTFVAPVDQRSSLTLGLCCYKFTDPGRDPVFNRLFAGVNRAARARGIRLDVSNLSERAGETLASATERFEADCLASDPDALIYVGNMNLQVIERLRAGRPTVVIGELPPGVGLDHIRRDIAAGAGDAVRRLATAGHRRIAFATYASGPTDYDMIAKKAGYRAAMEALGLEPMILTVKGPAQPKLLDRIAACATAPTAVVCSESTLGLALTRAEDAGIPDIAWHEIAITSFDDGDVGAVTRPPMTSIHAFGEELGELAVERLLQRLDGEHPDRIDELLPCPVIERVPHLS